MREQSGYFGRRRSLNGVFGEAVSSPVDRPKNIPAKENCLTEDGQAVAPELQTIYKVLGIRQSLNLGCGSLFFHGFRPELL